MAAYRFKICLEENEDVFRDIDIKAIQNFEDFHKIIQEAFKFDGKHAASFFVSDDYWRKGQEITLRKEDLPLEEEDIRKMVDPKKLMSEVKIAKYIEQPHQRFVYVFDPLVQWSFLIEMMRIVELNNKVNYPIIIKSVGVAPKQYKQSIMAKDEISPELALSALMDDLEDPDDDEILKVEAEVEDGIEDNDLLALEGEEGEEEETEAEDDFEGNDNMGFEEEHDEH